MATDLTQPIKLGSPDYVEQQVIRKLDALGTSVADSALVTRVAQNESDIAALESAVVLETDTSTASMQFVVDEDDMSSDSATKVPTQQSVKAYVDNNAGGLSEAEVDARVALNSFAAIRAKTVANTVNNDSVWVIPLGGNVSVAHVLIATNTGTQRGYFIVRSIATTFCTSLSSSGITASTGVKTGTTGAGGTVTLSVHTDNNLYVENRSGAPLYFQIFLSGTQLSF